MARDISKGYTPINKGVLEGAPEVIGKFPGKGNIAFDVTRYEEGYRVSIGERQGGEFVRVGESPTIYPGETPADAFLETVAGLEAAAFGEKGEIIDLFVNGELHRAAS